MNVLVVDKDNIRVVSRTRRAKHDEAVRFDYYGDVVGTSASSYIRPPHSGICLTSSLDTNSQQTMFLRGIDEKLLTSC